MFKCFKQKYAIYVNNKFIDKISVIKCVIKNHLNPVFLILNNFNGFSYTQFSNLCIFYTLKTYKVFKLF